MALFRTLPPPTDDLLPSLMVEVCLVLAPDVNFILNSRKQGLHCWRSLSFFLVRIWRVTSRPLLQTKTLRAAGFFKSASSSCQFVCIEHRMSM